MPEDTELDIESPISKLGPPAASSEVMIQSIKIARMGVYCTVVLCLAFVSIEWAQNKAIGPGMLISGLAIVIAVSFFGLISAKQFDLAVRVLLWLLVVLVSASMFLRNGLLTSSVVGMPMLIIVSLWFTGSVHHFRAIVVAFIFASFLATLNDLYGFHAGTGRTSPWIEFFTIATVLVIASFISFSAWRAYNRRFDQLLDAEREYRSVVENMVDAFIRIDLDGKVQLASPSAIALTEADVRELELRGVFPLFTSESAAELKSMIDAGASGGSMQMALTTFKGNWRWIAVSANHWLGAQGERLGSDMVLHDLTAHKSDAERVQRAERLESLALVTGGVAHDFNNMLSIILGNVELMQSRSAKSGQDSESLATVTRAANRGAELTEKLLQFSGRNENVSSALDVNVALKELVTMLNSMLLQQVSLKLDLDRCNWDAAISRSDFDNMLINLVANARDAIGPKGEIRIATREVTLGFNAAQLNPDAPAGDYVCVSVVDDGTGMSDATRVRAIEPFFTSKERGRGSGLGLSSVYGTIRRLSGDLSIESVLGRGTTISLFLPRSRATAGSDVDTFVNSELPERFSGMSALLVDDEPDLLKVNTTLMRQMGFSVTTAARGDEAEKILAAHASQLDVVVSDVVMPGGRSGYDVADYARQLNPTIAILLVSGFAVDLEPQDLQQKFSVLNKPFSRLEFERELASVLNVPADVI